MTTPVTIAVPKGRIHQTLVPLLRRAGLDAECLLAQDRTLVRDSADGRVRYLLLKPDDIPTYVEYGAAELGICGRDTLMERGYNLYQPVDLNIGHCRLVVATLAGASIPETPRVATKYPQATLRHFSARGISPEVIYIQGSVELGPVVGLADAIVDLVETGATLKENNLVEVETICPITSVLVANRALFKLRRQEVHPLVEQIRAAVE